MLKAGTDEGDECEEGCVLGVAIKPGIYNDTGMLFLTGALALDGTLEETSSGFLPVGFKSHFNKLVPC